MIPSFSVGGLQNPSSASSAYRGRASQGWMESATLHKHRISDNASAAVRKLQSFRQLNTDWDSYGAAKPSGTAITEAIHLVRSLDRVGKAVYFVAPGPDGEILVELRQAEQSVEVYFDEEGMGSYLIFDNGNLLHQPSAFQNVYQLLHACGWMP